jgi:ribosomal protein S18 acetylase RimI-like enzyme
MTRFTFKKAAEEQAEALANMAHDFWRYFGHQASITPEQLIKDGFSEKPRYEAFVIETAQQDLAGFAAGYTTYKLQHGLIGFEIQSLFIRESYRGNGLGRKLVSGLVVTKYGDGIREISLSVRPDNKPARSLYKSLEFSEQDEGLHIRCSLAGRTLEQSVEKTSKRL